MSIVFFILFGLVIGALARALMPGRQPMGLLATTLLGMAGSLVGGFLGALVTRRRVLDLNSAGLIGSLIGALLLLFIYTRVVARRHQV